MRVAGRILGLGLLTIFLAVTSGPASAEPPAMDDVPYQDDAHASRRPLAPPPWDRAAALDLSLGSMMINTIFFPVKLAIGLVGAELGGLAGAMNGGDIEAAAGVWNVTTDGSYFITPADLDGRGSVQLGGDSR